jgi:hypothetical protein
MFPKNVKKCMDVEHDIEISFKVRQWTTCFKFFFSFLRLILFVSEKETTLLKNLFQVEPFFVENTQFEN